MAADVGLSAAIELGEGEGLAETAPAGSAERSNAAEYSVAPLAERSEADTNAADLSVAHLQDQDIFISLNKTTAAHKTVRENGANSAKRLVGALADYANRKHIPLYALSIDHKRIAQLVYGDSTEATSWRSRGRVKRAISYAEKLGMLAVLCPGRPRPNGKIEGIPGLYAIIATHVPLGRSVVSKRDREKLIDDAYDNISKLKKTARRVTEYFEKLETFENAFGDTRELARERLKLQRITMRQRRTNKEVDDLDDRDRLLEDF